VQFDELVFMCCGGYWLKLEVLDVEALKVADGVIYGSSYLVLYR